MSSPDDRGQPCINHDGGRGESESAAYRLRFSENKRFSRTKSLQQFQGVSVRAVTAVPGSLCESSGKKKSVFWSTRVSVLVRKDRVMVGTKRTIAA